MVTNTLFFTSFYYYNSSYFQLSKCKSVHASMYERKKFIKHGSYSISHEGL